MKFTIHLSEVAVAVDVLLLMTVLQLVVLDVEPQSLHDAGPCLRVDAQQTGQPRVQFVLRRLTQRTEARDLWLGNGSESYDAFPARGRYLVIEHEQKGAFDVHVAGPFDLEPIRLLSGGHSVPLEDKMQSKRMSVFQLITAQN